MFSFHADDGRILTPPKELKPLLKDTFPAFFKTLGHIRFFYVADEIWDGKSSLIFDTRGVQLAAVTLEQRRPAEQFIRSEPCYTNTIYPHNARIFTT